MSFEGSVGSVGSVKNKDSVELIMNRVVRDVTEIYDKFFTPMKLSDLSRLYNGRVRRLFPDNPDIRLIDLIREDKRLFVSRNHTGAYRVAPICVLEDLKDNAIGFNNFFAINLNPV